MNYLHNPKTLTRIWAGLYCDFEVVITRFMGSNGWRYPHFAAICRQLKTTLVLHITQGRGKTKDEHYYRFMNMILQLCKELWLCNNESVMGRSKSPLDKSMQIKRSLAGFYLLYTMYERQPMPDQVKIALGMDDLNAIFKFKELLKDLPFRNEVDFMWVSLFVKNAFQFCIYPDDFRFDAATRYFSNTSKSAVVSLTRVMRDSADTLAYSSIHQYCEEAFTNLTKSKNFIAKDVLKTANTNFLRKHMQEKSRFPMLVKSTSGESLLKAMEKIEKMVERPVVSLHSLTATEAVGKIMAMETRKRMERARRKVMYTQQDGERVQQQGQGYVKEGGIFGRKKEMEDIDDRSKRRERGACNGNLWIYINGHDFDKPLGDQIPLDGEEVDDDALNVGNDGDDEAEDNGDDEVEDHGDEEAEDDEDEEAEDDGDDEGIEVDEDDHSIEEDDGDDEGIEGDEEECEDDSDSSAGDDDDDEVSNGINAKPKKIDDDDDQENEVDDDSDDDEDDDEDSDNDDD